MAVLILIFFIEEGTIRWHAHSDWARATVHGAIYIYPRKGESYPFPTPDEEVPIVLGMEILYTIPLPF